MMTLDQKKDLDMLLRNEWEFYDPAKTRSLKIFLVLFLIGLMWLVFFLLGGFVLPVIREDLANDIMVILMIPTILTLAFMVIVMFAVKRMNMSKDNWYFSCLQHPGLDPDQSLQMASDFLRDQGILFTQEKTKRTSTLFITMFDLGGKDFKMRVWFSKIVDVPILEIGFGPENDLNKKTIEDLRNEFSNMVVARYGPQNIPALPIDTTTLP